MSKNIVLGLAVVLALTGCGNNKEEGATKESTSTGGVVSGIGDVVSGVGKLNDVANASEAMTKHMEELKKMSPITNEQLKSALPDSLGGIARTSFEVTNNGMGLQTASAKFEKDANHYEVQVYDGAGEMGSAMFGMASLAAMMGTESESQTGYTKPFSIGDNKGSEKQDKTNADNISNEITLAVANRFVLIASSKGLDMDALKAAIKDSTIISKLEGLK
ncbi:MAG: hypothetical protein WBP13_05635 [Methylophilaceae bacterium]